MYRSICGETLFEGRSQSCAGIFAASHVALGLRLVPKGHMKKRKRAKI